MLSDRMQAVECSDFIFVAGMYPEIENMENTWDPSRNSCEALIVPNLTRPNIENSA